MFMIILKDIWEILTIEKPNSSPIKSYIKRQVMLWVWLDAKVQESRGSIHVWEFFWCIGGYIESERKREGVWLHFVFFVFVLVSSLCSCCRCVATFFFLCGNHNVIVHTERYTSYCHLLCFNCWEVPTLYFVTNLTSLSTNIYDNWHYHVVIFGFYLVFQVLFDKSGKDKCLGYNLQISGNLKDLGRLE